MTKQANLLLLLAVLALLRFVVVPVLDYQTEVKQQLELVTQQLDKANQLMLAKEPLQQAKASSAEQFGKISELFFKDENGAQFRLNQQQNASELLQPYQVEVSFFDWLGEQQHAAGQIEVHQAKMTLQGDMTSLMQAYTEVIATMATVRVVEFELIKAPSRRSKKRSSKAVKGSLTLMLEYSRLAKEQS